MRYRRTIWSNPRYFGVQRVMVQCVSDAPDRQHRPVLMRFAVLTAAAALRERGNSRFLRASVYAEPCRRRSRKILRRRRCVRRYDVVAMRADMRTSFTHSDDGS